MSLLSNFIRNNLIKALEEEVVDMAPNLREVALNELKEFGHEIIAWVEEKLNLDLDGDGKIGDDE